MLLKTQAFWKTHFGQESAAKRQVGSDVLFPNASDRVIGMSSSVQPKNGNPVLWNPVLGGACNGNP